MSDLPTGTVTLVMTYIEGSTLLLHELRDGYAGALARHRETLRAAFGKHGGIEADSQGDATFYDSLAQVTRSTPRSPDNEASIPVRCGSGWGSTPESRSSLGRATSGSMCTSRRASWRLGTVDKCWCPKPLPAC